MSPMFSYFTNTPLGSQPAASRPPQNPSDATSKVALGHPSMPSAPTGTRSAGLSADPSALPSKAPSKVASGQPLISTAPAGTL
jgi:hypothetical protein